MLYVVSIWNSLTQHKRMLDKGRTIREDLNLSSSSVTFLLYGFMSICFVRVWKQTHPDILFKIHNTPPLPINTFHEPGVSSVVHLQCSFCFFSSQTRKIQIHDIPLRTACLWVLNIVDVPFNIQVSDGIQIIGKFNRIQNSTLGYTNTTFYHDYWMIQMYKAYYNVIYHIVPIISI